MRNQWDRRIIPRWRSSRVSSSLFENFPSKIADKPQPNPLIEKNLVDDVQKQIQDWQKSPSLGVAADLLNFSHVPSLRSILASPAEFVIREGASSLTPQLRALAERTLGNDSSSVIDKPIAKDMYQRKIGLLKTHLFRNPRDAIGLVDIARMYAIKGQTAHATRAIKTAVALQPDNRFVLRSASRFYLHDGKPEMALAILKKTKKTQEDPWLLASMIAVETIQDKSPIFYKKAKAMIESGRFSPLHIAELSAALATLEANSGQLKKSRQMFNLALGNPNDNAVAQAIWAANEFSMPINIDPRWLSDRYSSEANYYTHEKNGDYYSAVEAALNWFEDEPFSTRPLLASSFAASILGDYSLAEDQVMHALSLDPDDVQIKNNLVFALASQNNLAEAGKLLTEIYHAEKKKDGTLSGHTVANIGMLFYRLGEHEHGRQFYEQADLILASKKDLSSRAIAMSFWVREAANSGDESLNGIIEKAKAVIMNSNSTAAKIVFDRATDLNINLNGDGKKIIRSAITWEHNKTENVLTISRKDPFKAPKK